MDLRELLNELKRRRVVRAAVAYAAALFVVLQVADIVLPALDLPPAVMTGLVVVGLLGFPLALALAWAVDLTPRAVSREVGPERDEGTPDGIAKNAESSGGPAARTVAALVAALVVVAGSAWWVLKPDTSAATIRSLAVLPLENLMGDDAQAHFVDGMHDVLIGELSRLDSLVVISRTSVMRYRGTTSSAGVIAAELGVDALLEGSVFRHGDSVRVNVQLIRARPEDHLWDGRYEGRLSQALALQARIADEVAREIELALSARTADYLAGRERSEVDPAAQDAYMRGMALWRTRDPQRLVRAIAFFEEAVRIDPDFALGWAGVANGYTVAHGYDVLEMATAEAVGIAERAAQRALELDPGLVEGRVALGGILLFGRQDYRGSERELSRAIELAPSHAQAHNWLGDALLAQGRLGEGLDHFERATELDPFSPLMHRDYARTLAIAQRCDEAVTEARTALDLDPLHFYAFDVLRTCALMSGDREEAVRLTFELAETAGTAGQLTGLREAYERGGMPELLAREARQFEEFGLDVLAAIRYALAGRDAEAFAALGRALDHREALLTLVRTDPAFQRMRGDPRWPGIIERLDGLATRPLDR